MTQNKEKGFTLGELLVVIAIMTVLVAVAVGSFTGLIGEGEGESKTYEKEAVQTAVDAWMGVNASGTITPYAQAVVGTANAVATYMRRLPTKYEYSWDQYGVVTQY